MKKLQKVTIEKNKNGEWLHPDIKKFWDENKNLNESQLNSDQIKMFEKHFSMDSKFIEMYQQASPQALHEYYQSGNMSSWNPNPPDLDPDWTLLAITDSEDGALAWWARPKITPT